MRADTEETAMSERGMGDRNDCAPADPAKHPKDDVEYGRRNLLHTKAVGAHANARSAWLRLRRQKRAPKWLVKYLEGIVDRTKPLDDELAAHRDEMW